MRLAPMLGMGLLLVIVSCRQQGFDDAPVLRDFLKGQESKGDDALDYYPALTIIKLGPIDSMDKADAAVREFLNQHPQYGTRGQWTTIREAHGFYAVASNQQPCVSIIYMAKGGTRVKYYSPK
jgi:hypothetical protein